MEAINIRSHGAKYIFYRGRGVVLYFHLQISHAVFTCILLLGMLCRWCTFSTHCVLFIAFFLQFWSVHAVLSQICYCPDVRIFLHFLQSDKSNLSILKESAFKPRSIKIYCFVVGLCFIEALYNGWTEDIFGTMIWFTLLCLIIDSNFIWNSSQKI